MVLSCCDSEGESKLTCYVVADTVKAMIEGGADLEAKSLDGRTPLSRRHPLLFADSVSVKLLSGCLSIRNGCAI